MTNTQFKQYLKDKLDALSGLELQVRPENFATQVDLLKSGLKIMTYGTGPARRRFRRDYERRMGL